MGIGGKAGYILNFGTDGMSDQLHALATLYLGEKPCVPIGRGWDGHKAGLDEVT
jgi:hypothetical protein